MSLGWDTYFVEIDGQVASLLLDLDPPSESAQLERPHLLTIRVSLRAPNPDGLASDEEFSILKALEDELEAVTQSELGGLYVGRYTHAARRVFLTYVPEESPDHRSIEGVLDRHGYSGYTSCEPDAKWTRYFDWLYPRPEELREIFDRRLVARLIELGDSLKSPREIEHWVYFQTEEGRGGFLERATAAGYVARAEAAPEDESSLGVRVTTHGAVDANSIVPVVRDLFNLALETNGEYDGWETFVVRS